MDSVTVLRTTSFLGLSSSLFLSGIYFCSTQVALPVLYGLPVATSTHGFDQLYHNGLNVVGPLVAFSSLCSAASAYLDSRRRIGYAIAGATTLASLPWTRLVMWGVIQRLLAISGDVKLQEKVQVAEVEKLLDQWGWMNLVRSGMAAVGGIVGLLVAGDVL
ncbi:hypothetical protein H2200_012131 [Cladophialophora chaetospira]|uniref:DUF1772-domain-containing protein n=1 Tax=Cladophialophora chaetospira TaxID=386627 RepID=A0AA38WYA3_9EURO|nr:hypothetical protein H2200_012131 [Cladophialophora chaetospira]